MQFGKVLSSMLFFQKLTCMAYFLLMKDVILLVFKMIGTLTIQVKQLKMLQKSLNIF